MPRTIRSIPTMVSGFMGRGLSFAVSTRNLRCDAEM
jgi:hypothetical protein